MQSSTKIPSAINSNRLNYGNYNDDDNEDEENDDQSREYMENQFSMASNNFFRFNDAVKRFNTNNQSLPKIASSQQNNKKKEEAIKYKVFQVVNYDS